MTPERYARIKQLFGAAFELPASKRTAFLESACDGDEELRSEVSRLLAENEDSLESPMPDLAATAKLAPGDSVGHYRIQAKLGEGGMGVVYKATDSRLGRSVALKFVKDQLSQRSQREARAVAALNHPHICTLHDVGPNYLVMEWIEGETLAARLAKGRIPRDQALSLAAQIAGALAEAHRHGIVHRDLKPANIMLTKSGAKVLDFGLAKLQRPISPLDRTETVTEPGAIMGTPSYMSPEQVQGKDADARSDIFSFGQVLYEMLSGQKAFDGASAASVMAGILEREPLPLTNIPPALNRLLLRCLEKDPDERWQSALDLKAELEWAKDPANAASTVSAAPQRQYARIALAAILVLALATGAWWLGGASRSTEPAKYTRLTFRRGLIQAARFAPDGRSAIYAASWEGQPMEMYSTQFGAPESRSLGVTSTGLLSIGPGGKMAVSSDCRYPGELWVCRGTLAEMSLTGGAPREVLERVEFADWARNGNQLAVTTWDNSRPRKRRLEFPMGKLLFEGTGSGWPGDPKVSPKGDMVAFADHFYYGDDGSVAVLDLNGRKRTLTQKFASLQGLAWSANGKEIWFTASADGNIRQLYAVNLSGKVRSVARTPANLTLQDIASDGRLLLKKDDGRSSIYVLGPGESVSRDVTWLDWATYPALSPDGKKLAMTESGEGATGGAVYVRGTDGSPALHLGDHLAGDSLSPDGKWLAAVTDDDMRPGVVLLPMRAGKPVTLDKRSLNILLHPTVRWFPDSQSVVFRASEDGHKARSFVQDIYGGQPRPITPEGISGVLVTPDGGSLLAFDSESRAFLYPVSGGAPKPIPFLTPGYNPIIFAADGRSLFVWKPGERPPKVWRVDLSTGHFEVWREIPVPDPAGRQPNLVQSVQITSDGRFLAWREGRLLSDLYLVEGLK